MEADGCIGEMLSLSFLVLKQEGAGIKQANTEHKMSAAAATLPPSLPSASAALPEPPREPSSQPFEGSAIVSWSALLTCF